jgi:hypothetical protein
MPRLNCYISNTPVPSVYNVERRLPQSDYPLALWAGMVPVANEIIKLKNYDNESKRNVLR